MIDKSIRQYYANGQLVKPGKGRAGYAGDLGSFNPFKKGYETIAGTFGPIKKSLTNTFLPQDKATGALDLGSMAKGAFKNIAMSKARNLVLNKLGLGALNPFLGLASIFFPGIFGGKGIMQGLAGRTREPGQTQAGYEQARELGQLGGRKDYMWNQMLENKPYSEKNLIDVINKIAKKKGAVHADDMAFIKNIDPVKDAGGEEEWGDWVGGDSGSSDYGFDDFGDFTGEGLTTEELDKMDSPAPLALTHYDETSWSGDSGDSGNSGNSGDSGDSGDSGSSSDPMGSGMDDFNWARGGRVPKAIGGRARLTKGGLTQRAPRKSMLKGGRVDKALTGRSRDI